jgi:hypothetical protein
MADKKNIIVGAARVWIGTAAAAKPAFVAATSYNVTLAGATGWRDAGYTQEGVEFSNEPEFGDVEVDQLLDSARIHKTSQRNTIATTFAEATLENLLVVWGQQDGTLSGASNASQVLTVVSGALGEAPLERQLIVVGNGRENPTTGFYNERTYHFSRALSVESSSFAQRRSEATVFPVTFRLLPDNNGNYGTFTERPRDTAWTT